MSELVKQIQTRLQSMGISPGPIDGSIGPLTRRAIREFQRVQHLPLTGQLDESVIVGLGLRPDRSTPLPSLVSRPWYDLALTKKGLIEGQQELGRFLRSDGSSVGDPSKFPWCGDLIQTCIALTIPEEPLPANPYLARNYEHFGVECTPRVGAVAVYWRGSKSGIQGHVAFIAGKGQGGLWILGGNQNNRVCVAFKDNERLLAVRWPATVVLGPEFLPVMKGGRLAVSEA